MQDRVLFNSAYQYLGQPAPS